MGILLILGFLQFSALAQSASPESIPQVMVIDPLMNPVDLQTTRVFPVRAAGVELPKKEVRDLAFHQNEVDVYVKDFDENKKNSLYTLASSAPVDRLANLFPEIPRDSLTRLRVFILRGAAGKAK